MIKFANIWIVFTIRLKLFVVISHTSWVIFGICQYFDLAFKSTSILVKISKWGFRSMFCQCNCPSDVYYSKQRFFFLSPTITWKMYLDFFTLPELEGFLEVNLSKEFLLLRVVLGTFLWILLFELVCCDVRSCESASVLLPPSANTKYLRDGQKYLGAGWCGEV